MTADIYFEKILSILTEIRETQREKMITAAECAANVIKNDGIIYIFGCGHSHLIALDCFYRSGGLANVSAMLDADLMLNNGAAKSSKMEKMHGIAENIFERYCISGHDMIFVISTSGKNAVPVEMAQEAKQNNERCVSVVSSEYFKDITDGKKLYECSDIYIDNCVPHGDAVIDIPKANAKMGSVSTAASSFIMQSVLAEAAKIASDDGCDVSVYKSGNVDGGAEFNRTLIKKYLPRIKHL